MTPIEWIVAIFAALILFKAVAFNLNPNSWIKFWTSRSKNIISQVRIIYLGAFFIVSYYLIQELTFVQYFGAMIAGMFLMAHTMMHYPAVMKKYANNFKNRSDLKKLFLDWLIWIFIAIMVLRELFFLETF